MILLGCDKNQADKAVALNDCKNNHPCKYLDSVRIQLSNETISPESPFDIAINVPNGWQVIDGRLSGVTMYMGTIPVQFNQNANQFVATTMLGACSEPIMTWRLAVQLIDAKGQEYQLHYYIDSKY